MVIRTDKHWIKKWHFTCEISSKCIKKVPFSREIRISRIFFLFLMFIVLSFFFTVVVQLSFFFVIKGEQQQKMELFVPIIVLKKDTKSSCVFLTRVK